MRYSIILPVYNKANTIIQALDSIYSQTVQDFEIIIVNDGSKDNVLDVLRNFTNPIRIINQENQGVSVARNTGIKEAKGEYLCFLDADDIWLPEHLETISNLKAEYPNCDYFATCHRCSYPDGSVVACNVRLKELPNHFIVNNLLGFVNKYGGIINTNGICIKRETSISENIYFEPGEKLGEDVDVWYRLALKHPIALSKDMTTLYRREFSTATTKTSNPEDWCFARRSQQIMSDPNISREVLESYVQMCDSYYMAKAREHAYNNNKERALDFIHRVTLKIGKKYVLSLIIVHTPWVILSRIPLKYKL